MIKRKRTRHDKDQLEIVQPSSPFAYVEAYKSLRTNLNFTSLNNQYRSIVMTSALPGEGKSSVAINLAGTLAEAGSKVLLIDCDLRKPMLHNYLRIPKTTGRGLSTVLTGIVGLEESIISFSNIKIDLLTAGTIPPNPTELLGSQKMYQLMQLLRQKYDFIICDAPPVSLVTDAAIVGQCCDGAILVVRQNYATFDDVKNAKNNLDAVNTHIIGAVMNQYDIEKSAKYAKGNYYYYNYNYGYSQQEAFRKTK